MTFLNESRTFAHPFDWHPVKHENGTSLWKLNLHCMEFLEGLNDERFQRVVDDWIAANPPFGREYWRDNWNSFALSIRCVVWMQQYALRRERLAREFADRLISSLAQQLQFLGDNLETDIGGNHLIKNAKALLWAGCFFASSEAAAWKRRGGNILSRELDEQIPADGMHFERSPAYHSQVFADLLECYAVLEAGALKCRLHQKLSIMAQAVADLTHPDGHVSLFNDGGLRMAYAPGTCLRVWKDLSGNAPIPRCRFALHDSGYYGLRKGDEFLLVDCGKVAPDFLPAHGHGDVFSFEWSVDGQRIVTDTGVYEYLPGPRRAYSRSTRAHNTVTLDDHDQCEFWGAFRMARRASVEILRFREFEGGFEIHGRHDGYRRLRGRPLHERRFSVRSGHVSIEDKVTGGNGQRARARILLHPGCTIENISSGLVIQRSSTRIRLNTSFAFATQGAPWYPDFGMERRTLQIVIDYGKVPCRGSFSLEKLS